MTLQLAPITDVDLPAVPNLPLPSFSWRTRISADPQVIEGTLAGPELELYRDHTGTAAAHHLVLTRGNDSCYIIFRKDAEEPTHLRCYPLR